MTFFSSITYCGHVESNPYIKRRIINIYLTTGGFDESNPYIGNMKPGKR